MFGAAKLLVAGAVVAAFGGYLLIAVTDDMDDPAVPGADAVGISCPEASALLEARASGQTADPSIISHVRIEPFGESEVNEESTTIDEADGYARVVFVIEDIPVEADDPRLDGVFGGEVTAHFFTEDGSYASGAVRIENEAGAWSGEFRGTDAFVDGAVYYELAGDGAYAGCAVSLHGDLEGGSDGIIYPASVLPDA